MTWTQWAVSFDVNCLQNSWIAVSASETFSNITQPAGSTGASREESPARWALILLINVHQGLKCGSQSVLNQLQVLTLDMRINFFFFSYSHFEGINGRESDRLKGIKGRFSHCLRSGNKPKNALWCLRRWSTNQTAQAGARHWCKLQKGKNAALGWIDKNVC